MKKIILAAALMAFVSIALANNAAAEKVVKGLSSNSETPVATAHNQTVPVTNKDKKTTNKHHETALLNQGGGSHILLVKPEVDATK